MAFAGPSAVADLNSKEGGGTANMPNDTHITRVATLETDDSEAFREFVQYGAGSESVNPSASEDTPAKRVKVQENELKAVQAEQNPTDADQSTRQAQEHRKDRPDPDTISRSRQGSGILPR